MTKSKALEYLESDSQWTNIKNMLLNLDKIKNRCWCCGSKDKLTRHHIFPQVKGKKKGIILVCRDCHDAIEAVKECISLLNEEVELTKRKLSKTKEIIEIIK